LYWWEKTWREQLENPSQPKQVIFKQENSSSTNIEYDLVYIGGALGALHAAMMAKLGHKVLLIERLPFGRMNREWNISRAEFQTLIDLELFTQEEFESIIAREYIDGFSKFFDGYIPKSLKAATLHTPTVLNIAINSDRLLALCGQKLKENGATIWDQTEFKQAEIDDKGVSVNVLDLKTGNNKQARARLLIDAMGTASPIAWQLNGSRTFDSVCPTVGAIVEGIDPSVWDARYGDVLNSHGDISRGRQLIWELFPGPGQEMTIYLFHYHQVHRDNPGSLLEMYEDFFHILPEYRRCDMDQLVWKKPTFGYIPGYFSKGKSDRKIAYDRILAIGDAASLQSPLIFTGFGSLVRNLGRLTTLLDIALKNDLLTQGDLAQISAYQSNVAVTWLFSKGMMVPTGRILPPERVNAMLNTFFGLLASEPPEVADTFIKDRTDWFTFTRLALKAARQNPSLLLWIWDMAGLWEMMRWLITFVDFTLEEISFKFLSFWFPQWLSAQSSWLERQFPRFWLKAQALQSRIQL
jgi:lycopene cyclase CruA